MVIALQSSGTLPTAGKTFLYVSESSKAHSFVPPKTDLYSLWCASLYSTLFTHSVGRVRIFSERTSVYSIRLPNELVLTPRWEVLFVPAASPPSRLDNQSSCLRVISTPLLLSDFTAPHAYLCSTVVILLTVVYLMLCTLSSM
jgi:hypothetical protein